MIRETLKHQRIEHLIGQVSSASGERIAVSNIDSACNYRQLQTQAEGLASLLRAVTSGPGQPIGVLLPNCQILPESILGVWHSGNVVVPISTGYARKTIARIVEALGLRTLLIRRRDEETYSGLAPQLLVHDDAWSVHTGRCDSSRVPIATTIDHAAVFLTSGTTGHPKIVALTHYHILTNLRSMKQVVPLGPDDKSFVCVPLCHSYGFTLQMLGTLSQGAELYIGSGQKISSDFAKELHIAQCTSFFGVPTAYRMLLDGLHRCGYGEELSHLRVLVNGAASMTPELLIAIRQAMPWANVHLTYGLSEASPLVTALPPEWVDTKPCSIGKAIPGVTIELLDEEGALSTKAGQVGEILIKGDSVIESYLGNDEANEVAFANGYLKTGDIAKIDSEGCLYFKGRCKDMINRGGEKIYPEDVEAWLQAHDAVQHAAVVACPHSALDEVPFAFVVLCEGCQVKPSALREWCGRSLSPQQIPMGIEIVDSLPKTATGKIRKAELVAALSKRVSSAKYPQRTEVHVND